METFMEAIRKNWVLIGFIAAMILWYGNVNSRISAVEAQVQETITSGQTDSEKVSQLLSDVAVIKSESKETSKKIDSLQSKVDYIINNMKR